jgi:hypothetical protein
VLLDRLAKKTKNVKSGLPLELTEYGFETDPPDPFSGIPLAQQAQWNMLGEYIAFRNSRVQGITQFLLSDVPPVKGKPKDSKSHWFTYQSGIQFQNGAPKPSFTAYYFPFLVRDGQVWGQLKFRPNGLTTDTVMIQHSADGGATWRDVAALPITNPMGFFLSPLPPAGPGLYRAAFPGSPVASLPAGV